MARTLQLATLVLSLVGLAVPVAVHAQWRQDGIPACRALDLQDLVRACPDGAGGIFLAWRDERNYASLDADIYVQRVTATGLIAPGWPKDGVAACSVAGSQDAPAVASDGAGGFFVAWQDARGQTNFDIYAQHTMANGTHANGWPDNGTPVCTALGAQERPQIVSDGAGGAFLLWDDQRNGMQADQKLYLAHVRTDATLDPGWPIDGLAISNLPGAQGDGSLAADGAGGMFVAWADGRARGTSGFDVYALRVTSSGTSAPGWPVAGLPISTEPKDQFPGSGHIVLDGAGGAYVGWFALLTPPQVYPDYDIYAQHVTGAGAIVSGWPSNGLPVVIAPGPQDSFSADGDGQGGLLIAWGDQNNGQVAALRFQPDGTRAPGWAAGGMHAGYGLFPRAVRDDSGGLYIAWIDFRYGTYDLFAQHLTDSGVPAAGWDTEGLALCTAAGIQEDLVMVGDGAHGAIAAWSDSRNNTTTYVDIYAERLFLDGPVPTLLSLADLDVQPGHVTLRWQASDAGSLKATVERAVVGEAWSTLGAPQLEGTDLLVYEDDLVTPGVFSYRLRYVEGSTERVSEPVRVEVPAVARLVLEGFRPNPALEPAAISFSLPDARPASLQVHDVRGRVVFSREVGGLGPGVHLVRLDESGKLASGIYWIRLVRAEGALTAKGIVVR